MHGSASALAVITDRMRATLLRRLLANLRKLSLASVALSMQALQPAAARLQEVKLRSSRLQGSADGFLTRGWTALTSLSLAQIRMENATLTAALNLPALESARLCWVRGHQGRELQIDQLTGSCPQISRLEFQLGGSLAQASDADRQRCRLGKLSRLADLHVMDWSLQANVDLDLPPSLTQLRFEGFRQSGSDPVDFFWALDEAVKCVRRGAQLHRLICQGADAYLQDEQWGPSLDEQHRQVGGALGCLKELTVWGAQEQLFSAVGAVASAAPSLVRLEIIVTEPPPSVEVSPICSASLESIKVQFYHESAPPQVLLTFLPGCTRLREVVVRCQRAVEGAAVKIRCQGFSRRCIAPVDGYAEYYNRMSEELYAYSVTDVVVKFLDMPPSEQGVQDCTILYGCHAAGLKQSPLWGHAVMPGIL